MLSDRRLAIETPAWRAQTDQEDYAYAIFMRHWPELTIQRTDKTRPLPFDAYVLKQGQRIALVEAKCREFTFQTFTKQYKSQWLLSESKLTVLARCALQHKLPAYGFLYFINCKILLYTVLASRAGAIVEREAKIVTSQQKYLQNTDTRPCALVSMSGAPILQWYGSPAW